VVKNQKTATIIKVPNLNQIKNMKSIPINKLFYTKHPQIDNKICNYAKTEYIVGEIKEVENDKQNDSTCSFGIHIAHKSWARSFGISWQDFALLEVETDIKDIVVSKDCDGKVRTSKIKVLREVPKSEYYKFN
jgi:hypothetical protein